MSIEPRDDSRASTWSRRLLAGTGVSVITGIGMLSHMPHPLFALWVVAGAPVGTLFAHLAGPRVNHWIHPEGGGPLVLAWSVIGAFVTWSFIFAVTLAAVEQVRQQRKRVSAHNV